MLQTNLNNFFIIISVVVGMFAILLIWVYLWETSRGLKITEIQIYKNYVNCSFVILWITTQGLDSKLMICFLILTVGWIVTAIGTLIFSAIVKNSVEDKRAMREAILPCIFKVIIMVAVLWLVY
jgi:hypothetical protein